MPDLMIACQIYSPKVSRTGDAGSPSQWAAKIIWRMLNYHGRMATEEKYSSRSPPIWLRMVVNSGLQLTPAYADLWKESEED